ncbi:hypothetical protein QQZ08_004849 [Neonectria magnoliae]|uniref:Uncharacterized protein n=1 Tax=Neonectria magnoliae TaxID=2732573 RepID=A0ABR1I4W6_9HYPO
MTPQAVDMIAALDADAFSANVPAMLLSASRRLSKERGGNSGEFADVELSRSRVTESPTIAAASMAMRPPLRDEDAYYVAWIAFHEVVFKLPSDEIRHYRPALDTLSTAEPIDADATSPHYAGTTSLP